MLTLAVDTSTEILSVALGDEENVLVEASIDAGRAHLEMLLPEVRRLLDDAQRSLVDVRAIVAGTGPGTFSGLRVGIATARALAQALGIPVYGNSSLDALADGLAASLPDTEPGWILPLIDARRGQVFARLYRKEGDRRIKPESEVLCLDPEKISDILPKDSPGMVTAGGNGAVAYHDILSTDKRLDLLEPDAEANRMRAVWHLSAARAADSASGFQPAHLNDVLPLYVREPDADKTILLKKREPWLK